MKITQNIIIKYKEHNEEAFNTIYETYHDMVYIICKKYLKNDDDIEDCLQDIFSKLWNNPKEYDLSKGNFDGWFSKVVKNYAIDVYRAKKRRKDLFILSNDDVKDDKYDKYKTNQSEILKEIKDKIGNLKYQILIYRIVNNMSFEQIANIMLLSRETTRRYYLEAFNEAKSFVEERNGDGNNE